MPRVGEVVSDASPLLEETIPGGHESILFIDDEPALARLGQEMLARLGYNVTAYHSGLEALETFRAAPRRFDLVITDQTMPQLTGAMLSRELRHIRPDVPIILCSGFSHTMTGDTAQTLGINAFLSKPLTTRDLARAIRRVLIPG